MNLMYILLGVFFIVFFMALTKTTKLSKKQLIVLGILAALTTVFDQLIILLDIVRYDTDKISQIYIGLAPIEDYLYCLGSVIIVPKLWKMYNK